MQAEKDTPTPSSATQTGAVAPPLVVDLDGTLIRTDLLYETAMRAAGRTPIKMATAVHLMRGKAALKSFLAEAGALDVSTLPYNEECIAFLRRERARGRKIILVSASDKRLVDAIANHLGLFDEVYGTGAEKYGERGFDYIADRKVDMAVWRRARKALTVNASPALRRRLEGVHDDVEHIAPDGRGLGQRLTTLLKVLRPHQWVKNLLVFVPIVTAHRFELAVLLTAMLAFSLFSVVASSVYVLNDLLDLEADRRHPRKRGRPFASGAVPIAWGMVLAPLLLGLGFGLAALTMPWQFLVALGLYYALTLGYSVWLKRRVIVDVICLGLLYTLRIIAGAAAVAIPLSPWLLALSMFLFLSLAIMKRMAELEDTRRTEREVIAGRGYEPDDLPVLQVMGVASGYTGVLVLALYINNPTVTELYKSPTILWGTCPLLLYWISRLMMKTHRSQMHDDPIVFVAKDPISLFVGFCIVFLMFLGAYL
ncbi:MAG: UbiA family prenyltransferase [Burkholderiales bacterium]